MKFKKQKDHWKELLPYEKRFEVAKWVLFFALAVFIALDFMDSFGVIAIGFDAHVISGVLITAALVCEAVVYWRTNRQVAHSSLVLAVIFGFMSLRNIVKLFL